jgi:hypothetical protein
VLKRAPAPTEAPVAARAGRAERRHDPERPGSWRPTRQGKAAVLALAFPRTGG